MRDSNSAPTKVEMVRVCRLSELSDGEENRSRRRNVRNTAMHIAGAKAATIRFTRSRNPHGNVMWVERFC